MKVVATIFLSFVLAISIYAIGNGLNDKIRGYFSQATFEQVFTKEQIYNKTREQLNKLALNPEYLPKLKEASKKNTKQANRYIYSIWALQLVLLALLSLGCGTVVKKVLQTNEKL
ncbi:hypothetical protein A3740_25805 [Oleiphilus sp. HI0068]|uniref:hypothetical protein n=1 Tax=unclassified Oleiphilus TaxID=2631174 RepID=UPI0007C3AA3B|nr:MULTISPECIES: hypothetical protein [unclassified Oleiphilus]KZY74102.1 hypothetical protein A3740_17515 [Oleiphilus sp. HI0068]KZY81070.1 hypothetical protein A3741_17925 [Oleiphilus sp. HI0069]KZY86107.1 hypothetical protein A3743_17650 [Oleiphilus sp. HI0072]KZY39802.1 hypothetical protein A3729_14440 [Oleiphilus sp. HI0043]KZY57274.1 hypothetical protein A3735_18750 [Oleiphilus sp. HI0061]